MYLEIVFGGLNLGGGEILFQKFFFCLLALIIVLDILAINFSSFFSNVFAKIFCVVYIISVKLTLN